MNQDQIWWYNIPWLGQELLYTWTFKVLARSIDFVYWKLFSHYLFINLPEITDEMYTIFYFHSKNEFIPHSDSGCYFSTHNSCNLSTPLERDLPWYGAATFLSLRETGSVSQSPSIPSISEEFQELLLIRNAQMAAVFVHNCIEICFYN